LCNLFLCMFFAKEILLISNKQEKMKKTIEKILFGSKWVLVPFYFGLVLAQIIYLYWFSQNLIHMVTSATTVSKEDGMLIVLELVDVVMIANLIKMIISGSYTSFITKDHTESSEQSSSGMLKVKMSTSLVGVSSIHLLQSFINSEKLAWETIQKQLWIHSIFLVGALVLMVIEYLHVKGDALEHGSHNSKTHNSNSNH
jgi:uncharacterized protein (TIGR00645 family)